MAPRSHAVLDRAGLACLVVMWLAQVSIALTPTGRRQIGTTVVVGALTAAVGCFVARRLRAPVGAAVVAATVALGLGAEVVGSRTGFPFGDYGYTTELAPRLAGVPVVVVLAWFAMGVPSAAVAARIVPSPGAGSATARVALTAVALTGWDLFLDPQMVHERYWTWPGGGSYHGIPASNYAGWLLVGSVLGVVLVKVAPLLAADRALAGVYALMSVMEVVGFAVFFGRPSVALAGGLVCLPLAALALRPGQAAA